MAYYMVHNSFQGDGASLEVTYSSWFVQDFPSFSNEIPIHSRNPSISLTHLTFLGLLAIL